MLNLQFIPREQLRMDGLFSPYGGAGTRKAAIFSLFTPTACELILWKSLQLSSLPQSPLLSQSHKTKWLMYQMLRIAFLLFILIIRVSHARPSPAPLPHQSYSPLVLAVSSPKGNLQANKRNTEHRKHFIMEALGYPTALQCVTVCPLCSHIFTRQRSL